MNVIKNDNAFAAAVAGVRPTASVKPERLTLFVIKILCVSGLVLANYYSWTMTVTGFVNAKFLPDNSVLPNGYIPFVVAGFIQLGIFSFYLSIPYFQLRHFVLNAVALVFAAVLISLTVLFSIFSITMTSQGSTIVGHELSIVRGIQKKIVDLDDLTSRTFHDHLAYLDALAQRACNGQDKSGIKKCGPISMSYTLKANEIAAKYGSQLGVSGSYPAARSNDILDALTTAKANYTKASQKIDAYKEFAEQNQLTSDAVSNSFVEIGKEIDKFSSSLGRKDPDASTLVLTRVLDDISKIFSGKPDHLLLFALMIAVLPDVMSITFSVILLIVRAANGEAMRIRRAVNDAQEQVRWYNRYAAVTDALHRAKQRWRDRRRVERVAEAVDDSVADTFEVEARNRGGIHG